MEEPKKKEKKKKVTIALQPSLIEAAKKDAVEENRSFSNYIESLILEKTKAK